MTDEKFLQAAKIKDELDYLKTGLGFAPIHNYKDVSENIEEVAVYSPNGSFKFHQKGATKLFEYVKTYLGNMEIDKQNRIVELEKQFAEL
jgi:putative NIF3 family GTP cyclohydrolase 1 type 2